MPSLANEISAKNYTITTILISCNSVMNMSFKDSHYTAFK